MSSAVRAFKAATGRGADDPEAAQEAEKYRLVVTAGPSYDKSKHKVVGVNTGESVTIENEFIRAKVKVRIRGFRGLPSRCPPTSPYFDDPWHAKDQYSVAFSFVPKQDLPSLNTVWGNDFDHPVRDRLPPGFNTAFKIVKEFIDPGLSCDAYADEPWLYGPSLSCWFAFRLGEKVEEGEDFPEPGEAEVTREGGDGTGLEERERLGIPENNEKRRKFFLDAKNRDKFVFEKGRCYQADFFNPYLDFGNCALKLPGFSLNVIKYVDEKSHCLRYVFKNRETGNVYLNVNIALLWDKDLAEALRAEKEGDAALQAVMGGEVGDTAAGTSSHSSNQAENDVVPKVDSDAIQTDDNVATKDESGPTLDNEASQEGKTTRGNESTCNVGADPNDVDETAVSSNSRPKPILTGLPEPMNETNHDSPTKSTTLQTQSVTQNTAIPGAQTDDVHQLLQSTATHDKRGSEAGIF